MQSAALGRRAANKLFSSDNSQLIRSHLQTHSLGQAPGIYVQDEDADSMFSSASDHQTKTLLGLEDDLQLRNEILTPSPSNVYLLASLPH